jgi:hypothetical protein
MIRRLTEVTERGATRISNPSGSVSRTLICTAIYSTVPRNHPCFSQWPQLLDLISALPRPGWVRRHVGKTAWREMSEIRIGEAETKMDRKLTATCPFGRRLRPGTNAPWANRFGTLGQTVLCSYPLALRLRRMNTVDMKYWESGPQSFNPHPRVRREA